MDIVHLAKFLHAIDVREKIQREAVVVRQRRKRCRPDRRRLLAFHWLAAFGLQQLQSNGFYFRAEIERLDVHRVWREIERSRIDRRISRRAHSLYSSASGGNFALNSADCFRKSSQSKNASGVSSQIRNQFAISSFSVRLNGSTL